MQIYETLMLSVPEITDDESNKLETQFEKMTSKFKGETVSFEKWGKFKLAYPVRKNDYGIYFLTRFKLPTDTAAEFLKELRSFFRIKFSGLVMREVTCALDSSKLEYKKPKSLGDLPEDAVGSFLKENKMGGLLEKKSEKPGSLKTEATSKETVSVAKSIEKKEEVKPETEKVEDGQEG